MDKNIIPCLLVVNMIFLAFSGCIQSDISDQEIDQQQSPFFQ